MIKNLKVFAAAALVALAAVGIVACDDKEETLVCTPTSLSFEDNGWDSDTVDVSGPADWFVTSKPEWIKTERSESKLIVTADDNDLFRERSGEIVVQAGSQSARIAVTQGRSVTSVQKYTTNGIPATAVSPNGRYVIGTLSGRSFVIDRSAGTTIFLGSGAGEVNPPAFTTGGVMLYDVSNTGLVVGCGHKYIETTPDPDDIDILPFSYNIHTKVFTWLRLTDPSFATDPDIAGRTSSAGNAWSVSADGRSISGYIGLPNTNDDAIQLMYLPVVWRDNDIVVLAHPLAGLGDGDNARGYMPRYMSDDGSVVAGYLANRYSDYVGVYWKLSNPGQLNFFKRDDATFFHNTETDYGLLPDKYPRTENLSADGKVITASIVNKMSGNAVYTPFSYNIDTGETTVATAASGYIGSFTLPGGAIICMGDISAFYDNGTLMSVPEWLLSKYNITVPADNYVLRNVSSVGTVIVGGIRSAAGYETIVIAL